MVLCGFSIVSCDKVVVPAASSGSADLGLLPGIDISQINRFSIQSGTRSCTIVKSGEEWLISEAANNRALGILVQNFLILLDTLPAGQGRDLAPEFLKELGITPLGKDSICSRLTIWVEGNTKPFVLDFGAFDDNFDKEEALIIGEKHMLRRAVYSPDRKRLFLVAYPFHEVQADPVKWFDFHLDLAPRHLKQVDLVSARKSIQWKRDKPYKAFASSLVHPKAKNAEVQKILSRFLREGTFFLPIYGDNSSLLDTTTAELILEDFNGHRFVLKLGQTFFHKGKRTDEQGSGFLALKEGRKNPDVLCRAIHYRSFASREDEKANKPLEDRQILITDTEIQPLIQALTL